MILFPLMIEVVQMIICFRAARRKSVWSSLIRRDLVMLHTFFFLRNEPQCSNFRESYPT